MIPNNINISDNFFGMIRNLSVETRLDLISLISESLKESNENEKVSDSWKLLFGAFDDNRSAEEIIKELRESRSTKRKIEDL